MLCGMKRLALLTALSCLACAEAGGADGGIPIGLGSQGCAPGYMAPDFARLDSELQTARLRWKMANLQQYRYDFARIAAPLRFPDVTVTVKTGKLQGVAFKNPAEATASPPMGAGPMETLFLEVTRALGYQKAQPCADLRVTFDAVDGHPTTFYSGSRFSPIADGYAEWRVTGFTARR